MLSILVWNFWAQVMLLPQSSEELGLHSSSSFKAAMKMTYLSGNFLPQAPKSSKVTRFQHARL